MSSRDEVQRLARRAAGGDLEAARRLVATLERMASKGPAADTEERAAWATFSRHKPEIVRRKGRWRVVCPICGNDDDDEFVHSALVLHTSGLAHVGRNLLVFYGESEWDSSGELQGIACKKCGSMLDFPEGAEVDFGVNYGGYPGDDDDGEDGGASDGWSEQHPGGPLDECSCDDGDPEGGFNPYCQVHGSLEEEDE